MELREYIEAKKYNFYKFDEDAVEAVNNAIGAKENGYYLRRNGDVVYRNWYICEIGNITEVIAVLQSIKDAVIKECGIEGV